MSNLKLLAVVLFLAPLTARIVRAADEAKPATASDKISYYRHVRPILQRYCSGCHQPAKQGGNLQLISFELFQKGGDAGPVFVAGKPDESRIVQNISGEKPEMPLNAEPLSKKHVETDPKSTRLNSSHG